MENLMNKTKIIMTHNFGNTLVFVIIYMNNIVYTFPFLMYGGVCNNSIDNTSLTNKRYLNLESNFKERFHNNVLIQFKYR